MKGKVGGYIVKEDFHGNFWVNVMVFCLFLQSPSRRV